MKRRYGPLSYVMTAARILSQEAPMLSVEIEGRPPLFGSVVLLGNGRHYGGPVPVFPNADNGDGLLDVLIIHHRRPLEAFQFLSALVSSGFQDCNDIDYLQVKSVKVTSTHKVPYELDGELGLNTPVEFRAAPFKLRVAC
jgi:diacylglycerol kinase family enzyme